MRTGLRCCVPDSQRLPDVRAVAVKPIVINCIPERYLTELELVLDLSSIRD
jgi:hypothetical protein